MPCSRLVVVSQAQCGGRLPGRAGPGPSAPLDSQHCGMARGPADSALAPDDTTHVWVIIRRRAPFTLL